MTQVTFAYKSGRERVMGRREAEILRRLGHGTYMTRDMRAETHQLSPPDIPVVDTQVVAGPTSPAPDTKPAGPKDVPIEPKIKRKYTRKAKPK